MRRHSRWLVGCVVWFLAFASTASAAEPDYDKDPVVMVHGYLLGETGTWTWLKNQLVDNGWPEEYLFSLQFDNVVGCNPAHAEAVAGKVQYALAQTGKSKVDIIAHSMGGLDTRYYIKYLCGYQYVQDVVTLAGAHKGSIIACLDFLSCGADQMCVPLDPEGWKDNDFLYDLNYCDQTPGSNIKYTSIWTGSDEIIVPPTNSIIEGARNVKLVSLVGHGLILLSEEALGYVMEGLEGGGLNDNEPMGVPPCYTQCAPINPEPEVEPSPEVVEYVEWTEIVEQEFQPDVQSQDQFDDHYEVVDLDSGDDFETFDSAQDLNEDADEGSSSGDSNKDGAVADNPLETGGANETAEEPSEPARSVIPARTDSSGCSSSPASILPVSPLWLLWLVLLAVWLLRKTVPARVPGFPDRGSGRWGP